LKYPQNAVQINSITNFQPNCFIQSMSLSFKLIFSPIKKEQNNASIARYHLRHHLDHMRHHFALRARNTQPPIAEQHRRRGQMAAFVEQRGKEASKKAQQRRAQLSV